MLYADVSEHSVCPILIGKRLLVRLYTPDFYTYLPMKTEQAECSETSAYNIQTAGNYPEENIQHTEHGESLKSR